MTDDASRPGQPWAAPGDDLWAAAGGASPPPPPPPPPPSPPQPPGPPPPSSGRPPWLLPAVLGVAAVLVAVVLVVVLTRNGDEVSEDSSPPTVATTVPATTVPPTPAPTTTAAATTTTSTTTTSTTEAPTTTLPSLPAGLTLTQAAADGVHSLSGTEDVLVAGERVQLALAVGDGSFLVQNRSGRFSAAGDHEPADTEIRRIGAVNAIVVPAQTGQWNRLHDVEVIGGRPLALVSIDRGSTPEDTVEELFLVDLDTGERRFVATIGEWETGTSRLHLADGLIVGEWSASAYTGPLAIDLDGNPALDPASVGLEPEYLDCADCPRAFSISAAGDLLAWVHQGTLVVHDLRSGIRLAELPLGEVAAASVDSIEVGAGTVVLNLVDSPGGEALAPVVVTLDGTISPLTRRGIATID